MSGYINLPELTPKKGDLVQCASDGALGVVTKTFGGWIEVIIKGEPIKRMGNTTSYEILENDKLELLKQWKLETLLLGE